MQQAQQDQATAHQPQAAGATVALPARRPAKPAVGSMLAMLEERQGRISVCAQLRAKRARQPVVSVGNHRHRLVAPFMQRQAGPDQMVVLAEAQQMPVEWFHPGGTVADIGVLAFAAAGVWPGGMPLGLVEGDDGAGQAVSVTRSSA